jgi:hypothetical protein
MFNLLLRLYINGSALEFLFFPISSGMLPGDGEQDRRCDLFLHYGGGRRLGPDCFFNFSSRVFCAKPEDQVIFAFLFVFLTVNPTV